MCVCNMYVPGMHYMSQTIKLINWQILYSITIYFSYINIFICFLHNNAAIVEFLLLICVQKLNNTVGRYTSVLANIDVLREALSSPRMYQTRIVCYLFTYPTQVSQW